MACALFLFLLSFLSACGVPPEALTESRQHSLLGGIDDDGDGAVVLIIVKTVDGMAGLCTGTVIGQRTVLTAAHGLTPQVVGREALFSVFLGADFRTARGTPGLTRDIERAEFDSEFDADLLHRGHDIGVLFSTAPNGWREDGTREGGGDCGNRAPAALRSLHGGHFWLVGGGHRPHHTCHRGSAAQSDAQDP